MVTAASGSKNRELKFAAAPGCRLSSQTRATRDHSYAACQPNPRPSLSKVASGAICMSHTARKENQCHFKNNNNDEPPTLQTAYRPDETPIDKTIYYINKYYNW